jgi:hypothetical protein
MKILILLLFTSLSAFRCGGEIAVKFPSVSSGATVSQNGWLTQFGLFTTAPGGNNGSRESCFDITLDSSGNAYCSGSTLSNFGEGHGAGCGGVCGLNDAFVMKLNSSGDLIWLTHLGITTTAPGGINNGDEFCYGVAADSSGNVYCAGYTNSGMGEANSGGGNNDAFIMKLDTNGNILWLTQLGATTTAAGGNNTGNDFCRDVSVDASGNVYCAGYTTGALGEAHGGGTNDAFVMKLDTSGNILWLTQLGATTTAAGGNNAGDDQCLDITVNASGNVYCAGSTTGAMGEVNGGGGNTDAFVMKLDTNGNILWLTQLGNITKAAGGDNSLIDTCSGIDVDSSGNVFCTGSTSGAMGEANGGGGNDAFTLKLDSAGNLIWLTQLGATTITPGGDSAFADNAYGVAVDAAGKIYSIGKTFGSLGEANSGGTDVFVLKLASNGDIEKLTQLGASTVAAGGDNSSIDNPAAIAVDGNGNTYTAGSTFGAFGETNGGFTDVFILKLNANGEPF